MTEDERAQATADKARSLVKASDVRRMYEDALTVQGACNLSGVVFSFAEHMQTLCDMGLDTDEKNSHPVSVLFADKIADMTGRGKGYSEAHHIATEKSAEAWHRERSGSPANGSIGDYWGLGPDY